MRARPQGGRVHWTDVLIRGTSGEILMRGLHLKWSWVFTTQTGLMRAGELAPTWGERPDPRVRFVRPGTLELLELEQVDLTGFDPWDGYGFEDVPVKGRRSEILARARALGINPYS